MCNENYDLGIGNNLRSFAGKAQVTVSRSYWSTVHDQITLFSRTQRPIHCLRKLSSTQLSNSPIRAFRVNLLVCEQSTNESVSTCYTYISFFFEPIVTEAVCDSNSVARYINPRNRYSKLSKYTSIKSHQPCYFTVTSLLSLWRQLNRDEAQEPRVLL